MSKTYQEIFEFRNLALNFLREHEKENTKFHWALNRMLKRVQKAVDSYNDKVNEINVEHCSVDEKGNILENVRGGFVFSKDEIKKRDEDNKRLREELVDIEPYEAKTVPELKFSERAAFTGFVIPEELEGE